MHLHRLASPLMIRQALQLLYTLGAIAECSLLIHAGSLPNQDAVNGWVGKDGECPSKCSEGGTCNPELGRCDCPPYPHGPPGAPCATPLMPACELEPNFVTPCGTAPGGRTTCGCLEQCNDVNVLFMPFCFEVNAAVGAPEYKAELAAGVEGKKDLVDFHSRRPVSDRQKKDRVYRMSKGDMRGSCKDKCNDHGYCSNGRCHCFFGFKGGACELQNEQVYCSNSCMGHGTCLSGFCQCNDGYFGIDCSLTKDPSNPGKFLTSYQQWAAEYAATLPPEATATPLPKIYIYELPPRYNAWLLYHHDPARYNSIYSAARFMHERLLTSEYRTTDPAEADFFFIPIWNRAALSGPPRRGGRYFTQLLSYVQETWPYFNRTNGRDHMLVITDDHGICDEANRLIKPPQLGETIIITHWGFRVTPSRTGASG
ncbi:hypothetical protein CYMTET_28155 [Cymbomonas tetramitiformis]|uniref:EGF-like domain-containing protein n=1 Tax=Cymbomonas tetramitiformis TaxID=36881 RepID=A0AAE0FNJ9_9CHLO|nr:hypothetical protein CYMTET_28155 [Cymbomonas tetramitiformis]